MHAESAFKVSGIVLEALPNRTYYVRLANGHRLRAFVPGKASQKVRFDVGEQVQLELSPYDLGQGRIRVGQCVSPALVKEKR